MQIAASNRRFTLLTAALAADALIELAIGLFLTIGRAEAADWLGVPVAASVAIGVVFLLAAVPIGVMAAGRAPESLTLPLAWANMAGGVAGWVALLLIWSAVEPEGRWLLAATFDSLIAIGAVEILLLRKERVLPSNAPDSHNVS